MDKQIERLLSDIEDEALYARPYTGIGQISPAVLESIAKVPRHLFVPLNMRASAYDNNALPIGYGQTISQPYIVALMTDLLKLPADAKVLEIGTGSGYQSAVLSHLCNKVYTIELVKELGERSAALLAQLGYKNIETRIGNGYFGWREHAPFDGIIVTAAATHIPQPLVDQLKPGSKLVIPIGLPYSSQELMVVDKNDKGETFVTSVLGVAFVPLRDSRAD